MSQNHENERVAKNSKSKKITRLSNGADHLLGGLDLDFGHGVHGVNDVLDEFLS